MFKDLRQGSPFYILHKTNNPYCEVGSVVGVSNLRPKNPNFTPYPGQFPQEMIVDITVKVGDDNVKLSSVSAEGLISDYKPDGGDKMVLACDLNSINSEINAMHQHSQQILGSIDVHKSIIEGCEQMLNQLNPQFAKEKAQEEKIRGLERELAEMKEMFGGGISELKQLLLDKQSTNNKKAT